MQRLDLTLAPIQPKGRDFSVWLTREAILEAVPEVKASKLHEDRLAAQTWIVLDTVRQAGEIRRMLRNGGAR